MAMEKDIAKLEEWAIRLHPEDDVAIAKEDLAPGLRLRVGEVLVEVRQAVAAGHKLALRGVAQGEAVRRYGQVIGFAKTAIAPGEHVHTHNLGMESFEREFKIGEAYRPFERAKEARSFWGYRRADGQDGDAQLRGGDLDGELLGARHPRDCPLFHTGKAGGLPERGRGDRPDPRLRLRGGYRRRELHALAAHAGGDGAAIRTWPAVSWSGWAARRTSQRT